MVVLHFWSYEPKRSSRASLSVWCYVTDARNRSLSCPDHVAEFILQWPQIMFSLNVFSTRRQLHVETWNIFQTSTSRMAKLMVFILFALNLSSVGFAVVPKFAFISNLINFLGAWNGRIRFRREDTGLLWTNSANRAHCSIIVYNLLRPSPFRVSIFWRVMHFIFT